ncbi:MAG: hypothetical protein ACYTEQ_09825 [Planctomycetota bacterium]|jgi:thymidylate kinase
MRGKFAVLMGVDGSGKSTTRALVEQRCVQNKINLVHLHWRPYLLPSPRRFYGGKPTYDANNPHSQGKHGVLISLILLLYYFVDFWLGHIFTVCPALQRGSLVVFERYYYDILADPRRYRLTHLKLSRFLAFCVPQPDALFVLYADPRLIRERKPELSVKEIEKQQAALRDHLDKWENCHWLDVGRLSPAQVTEAMWQKLGQL